QVQLPQVEFSACPLLVGAGLALGLLGPLARRLQLLAQPLQLAPRAGDAVQPPELDGAVAGAPGEAAAVRAERQAADRDGPPFVEGIYHLARGGIQNAHLAT